MYLTKTNYMNKEKVLSIINDVITERVTQLIEEMSNNEFVDMICEKVSTETNIEIDEVTEEEIVDLIGSRVIPLYGKMSEYLLGVDFYEELTKDLK